MVTKYTFSLLALVLLASCSGEEEVIVVNSGLDSVFTLPAQLRNIAAITPEDLTLQVKVNEQLIDIPRSSTDPEIWSAIVNVPANQTSSVNVTWSQLYATRNATGDVIYDLTLANERKSISVGSEARSVDFLLVGYNTDHDQDGDGLSNLAEVEEGRSPVDRVDAYITADGAYPTGLPQSPATQCGTQIPSAIRVQYDGDPAVVDPPEDLTAWWCATFVDEQTDAAGNTIPVESIKIFVNVVDDISPITDSPIGQKYNDDSVEIFIDGNNSKGINYDGIDDYQFVFLADGDNSVPLAKGPGAVTNLQSVMQPTATGYQLTVFIPRIEVGIQRGQPFGINVEVNDDDNGGLRDAKYSWIGKLNQDRSWTQPRALGTSQIPP